MGFSDSARIEKAGGTPEEARAATYEWGRTAGYLGTRAIALWTVSLILRAKIEEHAD